MYPEPSNLVDSLVAKSKLADNSEFTIENEVTLALSILNIKTDELIQQIMAEEKDNKKKYVYT